MNTPARVIVVDDDASIRDAIADCLLLHGYQVRVAADAAGLDLLLLNERPDAIILDWMMPGEDGLSVCRRLQARAIPILMLSAMGATPDRVIGLEMGADDYLAKPFDPRELLARVRALLRRQDKLRAQVASELRFAGWRLLPDQRRLFTPDGRELALSRGEFALMLALAERPGRVLGREQLLQLTHGEDSDSVDRAVDLAISRLRRKLGQAAPGAEALVQTLRGEGYRFGAEVHVL
ncbi:MULTISPECIES: response regulator transcription factor [Stenotrophomonas]|uniref:DNA-binding response regulator n=1 Tax=Stenotrophomonas maltophilia TaxID=40324 RepID=A0A2J0T578_STEMA|nr:MULTISPECIES: response regulator transcription factor [Stenotrophomonas]MBA0311356.1 DNA-binding response regulator [Stenotrophomonas maltophilia]MBH1409449.1 response regulator transcription factor [Stenotrophomonas maltophilia]MBH1747058.1 response regulator transcription factor [Stenotrophomonas maltophilia]MBH1867068.1 response regulator transcription factor [Stenotrophomonas maltophilia]MDH1390450.1 response regulator transcription factor [Stenotrophomonas sp. GD03701]